MTTTKPLTIDQMAEIMEVPPKRIRWQLRLRVWDRWIVTGNPITLDPAILGKQAWFGMVTGTNDRSKWPKSWTGFRGSRKQELKMLRKAGGKQVLKVEPIKGVPAGGVLAETYN